MEHLQDLFEKFNLDDLEQQLASLQAEAIEITSGTYNNTHQLKDLYDKLQSLESEVNLLRQAKSILNDWISTNELLEKDSEMVVLAYEELEALRAEGEKLTKQLLTLQNKKSTLPNDDKFAIFEFRPGVGGAEASLFTSELANSYITYIKRMGLSINIISEDYSDNNDCREISFVVENKGSYGKFRFEAGVIRVQRIPKTESKGRIHTSTISLSVIPQIEMSSDITISDKDIRIDVFRSSGPGGQSVNTTDSAVRITHLPTGITVACQSGKSQHQNKETAMKILKSKLQKLEDARIQSESLDAKKAVIQDSERSSKIRTFNFPQSRVTDHRIEQSWFNISEIMQGGLDDLVGQTNQLMRERFKNQNQVSTT